MKILYLFVIAIPLLSFAGIYPSIGNKIRTLTSGQELNSARLKIIQEAEKFIYIKTFIINRDQTEAPVYEALCEKAQEGIDVRFLVDDIGRRQGGNPIKKKRGPFSIRWFRNCGIKFEAYAKISWGPLPFALYNQHDKLFISEKEAILGGTNFSKDYSGHGQLSSLWYDFDIALSGPAVCDLQNIFKESWLRAYRREFKGIKSLSTASRRRKIEQRYEVNSLPSDCHPPIQEENEKVTILFNDPLYFSERPFQDYILNSLDEMIKNTPNEIVNLYAPYFIPSKTVIRKLIEASRSGLKIRIITNSKSSIDTNAFGAYAAMLMRVRPLLLNGVEIYLWTPSLYERSTLKKDNVFHKKGGCFGNQTCFVGSHNLDLRGDKYSSELMAILSDEEVIRQLKSKYEEDLGYTTQMMLENHGLLLKQAGITEKLIALIAGWAM